jgi:hypothetical protein
MATSITPEAKDLATKAIDSPDIYRAVRGPQLAGLCGRLATWGIQKFTHPPNTYRPGSPRLDTRLTIVEGEELLGLEMRAETSPVLLRSIHKTVKKRIPEEEKPPDKPIVARFTTYDIDNEGRGRLWLVFDQDPTQAEGEEQSPDEDDIPVYGDRQYAKEIIEEATQSSARFKDGYVPKALLMDFAPETITPLQLRALAYQTQKEVLPIPVMAGRIIVPSWMRPRKTGNTATQK